MPAWRVRLASLVAAGGFLAVALGIRVLASGDGVLDSSGALPQHSGTALYAGMVYAGVFLLAPRTRPYALGVLVLLLAHRTLLARRSRANSRESISDHTSKP